MLRYSAFFICVLLAAFQPLLGQNADEQVSAAKCWAFEQDGFETFDAVGLAGGVVLADRSASLIRISKDGEKLWQSDQAGALDSNIAVGEGSLFFVTRSQSGGRTWFREVSLQTGLQVFSLEVGSGTGWRLISGKGSVLYIFNSNRVLVIDIEGRRKKWERHFDGGIAIAIEGSENNLWIVKKAGTAVSVEAADGSELQRFPTVGEPISAIHSGTSLLVGTANGDLRSFRNGAGTLNWKFRAGGRISHLLNDRSNVIAVSDDNFIYSFDQRNGSLRWKRRVGGRVSDFKMLSPDYAAVKVIDANFWEITDIRTGRLSGRVLMDQTEQMDKLAPSLVRLEEGFAIGYRRGVSRYSLSKCP